MAEEKQDVVEKLPHIRSSNFSSTYVTGVVVSGKESGAINFIFFEDAVQVLTETLHPVGVAAGGQQEYMVSMQEGDLQSYREDKVRISMPREAAIELYELLKKRFGSGEQEGGEDQ